MVLVALARAVALVATLAALAVSAAASNGGGNSGGGGGGGDGGGNGVRELIDTLSPKKTSLTLFVLARNTRRSALVAHIWSNRYVIFVVWHRANV